MTLACLALSSAAAATPLRGAGAIDCGRDEMWAEGFVSDTGGSGESPHSATCETVGSSDFS
jgi:hypothetical protein